MDKLLFLLNQLTDGFIVTEQDFSIRFINEPMVLHLQESGFQKGFPTLLALTENAELLTGEFEHYLRKGTSNYRFSSDLPWVQEIANWFSEIRVSRFTEGSGLFLYCFKRRDVIETSTSSILQFEGAAQKTEIHGKCESIKRLLEDIYMVAHTTATVLVRGETGTGKELVARTLHKLSNRRNGPMVSINCGAIPPNLIESELFGHEKGAFTGAVSSYVGKFRMADKGTLFLDEIGELPLEIQVKLLRVLQESEITPVGSNKTHKIDVRVIAATHRDLEEQMVSGKFREDLYYRLNVFPLQVPPLRERKEDIEELAWIMASKIAKRESKSINPLSPGQLLHLREYHWPGNVRELQNVVERAVILSREGELDFRSLSGNKKLPESLDNSVELPVLNKEQFLEFERQNIIRALEKCNWKVSGEGGAAELLGVAGSTLSSRILALKIKKQKSPVQ